MPLYVDEKMQLHIYVDLAKPHIRDQVEKLNAIAIPERNCPKSAPNDSFGPNKRKQGTRQKPDSLSDSKWCRRGDSNPHGFPHHPLKPSASYCSL